MKIVETRIMRGPNYWSGYWKKLIVATTDLEGLEAKNTTEVEGFVDRIETLIPSLANHPGYKDKESSLLHELKSGMPFDQLLAHLALELQCLGGMCVNFGNTFQTPDKHISKVVFSYLIEKAGAYSARAACDLINALTAGASYDLAKDINQLQDYFRIERLGPSTQSIVEEAERRNIPVTRMDKDSLVMLGYGCNQKLICATIASTTSSIGVDIVSNKEKTKEILANGFIPVPKGKVVVSAEELDAVISELDYPLAIKPLNGNHGRGVTTNIRNRIQAAEGFARAQKLSREVIVERYIAGSDHRFLVINYKLIAAAKRTPAMVVGDDRSTIGQLIEEANKDPNRGFGHECLLTKILIDESTNAILEEKGLTLNSVLPIGEVLFLKNAANLSSGGTARDITSLVHPKNVFLAERVARLLNLDICGIDLIAEDVSMPIDETNGAVLEVNAAPGFRMHLAPTHGVPRNVSGPVLDMLYPPGKESRIPIVAVTGTNGKTTTSRLIAHLTRKAGHVTGYTTTDGIYINGQEIHHGDCSGPSSAAVVLRDPSVTFAVLECARGGILRAGLGFDQCNVSVVTNISEDHMGLNGIHTLDEMAKVKAVVPQATMKEGYAVLNADDERVLNMRNSLSCNIALFSMNPAHPALDEHCRNGGLAATVEDGFFVVCRNGEKMRIISISEVPLAFEGSARFMIQNILAAMLAGIASNLNPDLLLEGLRSFVPSHDLTPGRMNLFKFKNFGVMIDYVHNEGGFSEMIGYINHIKASVKIGIIGATGDRRDKDIRSIGSYAAKMFDEIIIRHDKYGRGRTNEALTRLLTEGINAVDPDIPVTVISNECEALQYAIDLAPDEAFIFENADDVRLAVNFVLRAQEKENKMYQDTPA